MFWNVNNLSTEGILQITQNSEQTLLLQILQITIIDPQIKLVISDGFLKMNVYINKPEILENIANQKISQYDIVAIFKFSQMQDTQFRKLVYIDAMETLYTKVSDIIGNPLGYQEFQQNNFQNPKGSNEIPEQLTMFTNQNTIRKLQGGLIMKKEEYKQSYESEQDLEPEEIDNDKKIVQINDLEVQDDLFRHFILATVTWKGPIYKSQYGDYFFIKLKDQSNQIDAFVASQFYDQLNKNNNYFIQNFTVKNKKNKSSNSEKNINQTMEIKIDENTVVTPSVLQKEEYIPQIEEQTKPFQEGNLSKLDVCLDNPEKFDLIIYQKDQIRFTKNSEQFFFGKFQDSKNFQIDFCVFGNDLVNKWYDFFQEKQKYSISHFQTQRKMKNNQIEIKITSNTQIVKKYSLSGVTGIYTDISNIHTLQSKSICSTIGVIIHIGDIREKQTSLGIRNILEIKIKDHTNQSIQVHLWGEHATQYSYQKFQIITLLNVKFDIYQNVKKLVTYFNTTISDEPSQGQYYQKILAYQNEILKGGSIESKRFNTHYDLKTLKQVEQNYDSGKEKKYFEVKFCISFIQNAGTNRVFYNSCVYQDCMRKVVQQQEGYYCQKCDKKMPDYNPRFILQVKIVDQTDFHWAFIPDPAASEILGFSAQTYRELYEKDQQQSLRLLESAYYRYVYCKIMVYNEVFNGIERIQYKVLNTIQNDSKEEMKLYFDQVEDIFNF